MKTKQEWLPRRAFASAYAHRWQISEPTHETCSRWARSWEKKNLARWVVNASVGAGGYWEFSTKSLAIAPTPSGPKPKQKKSPYLSDGQDGIRRLDRNLPDLPAGRFSKDYWKKK